MNLLLLPQSTKTVPLFLRLSAFVLQPVVQCALYLLIHRELKVHLDVVRRLLPSVQIAEILRGLEVSASVRETSTYMCNVASTDTKSWLKTTSKTSLILLISHHCLCTLTNKEEII